MRATVLFGLLSALPTIANAQGGISGIKISNLHVDGLNVDVDVGLQATDTCVMFDSFTAAGMGSIRSADYGCRLLGPRTERRAYQASWPLATPSLLSVSTISSGMTLLSPELNAIDWGDGNAQEQATLAIQANPINSWKGTFSHTYADGSYTLTAGVFRQSFNTITAGNPVYANSPQVRFWSSTWASTSTHSTSWIGLTANTDITVPGNINPNDGGPISDGGVTADGGPTGDSLPTGDGVVPTGDSTVQMGDTYRAPTGGGSHNSSQPDDGCNSAGKSAWAAILCLCCIALLRRRDLQAEA